MRLKEPVEDETPQERFARRRAQWAKLHKNGALSSTPSAGALIEEEIMQEGTRNQDDARMVDQLDKLFANADSAAMASMAPGLKDGPWEHAIECLAKLKLDLAWQTLRDPGSAGREGWPRVALAVGRAALAVDDDGEVADRDLSKAVVQTLVEREDFQAAAELLLEFAAADAQAGANLLAQARKWRRSMSREGMDEEHGVEVATTLEAAEAAEAESSALFKRAMTQIKKVITCAREWKVPAGVVSQWNRLVRLVAKRRNMPQVFKVLNAMEVLDVKKDIETYEFIARAAVANVSLRTIADSCETMPSPNFPEVIFIGRSNVGKSSLVNCLLHRSAFAPVSVSPGCTTRFHFYDINARNALFPRMTFVDVPGLGVAVTDKAQLAHWKSTLFKYLRSRGPALRGVFHLVSGHAITRNESITGVDEQIAQMARKQNVEYTMVLTKCDRMKQEGAFAQRLLEMWQQKARFRIGHYILSSSITRQGLDKLWRRLWRCVDPKNPRWAGNKLLSERQELEELTIANASSEIAARAKHLKNIAWEDAVRCLVTLGELKVAWRVITEAATPRQRKGGQMGAEWGRAALVVGEAALAASEAATPVDRPLAEEILAALRQGGEHGAAVELLLEFAVADARSGVVEGVAAIGPWAAAEVTASEAVPGGGSSTTEERDVTGAVLKKGEPLEPSLRTLQQIMAIAKEGGKCPWSIERWNRLMQCFLGRRDFAGFAATLDVMAIIGVKEVDEMHTMILQEAIASMRCVAQGDSLANLTPLNASLPEVVFLDASGDGKARVPLLRMLLSQGTTNWVDQHLKDLEAKIRVFEFNSQGLAGGALPPFACVNMPLIVEPIADGGTPAEGVDLATKFSDWCADIRSFLSRPHAHTPGVFHVLSACLFTNVLRSVVPTVADLRPEDPLPMPDDCIQLHEATDLAIQATALGAGVSHYTLVVLDAYELGRELRIKKSTTEIYRAHPRVIRQRGKALVAALQRSAAATAIGVDFKVILADASTGQGRVALWRRLWDCTQHGRLGHTLEGTT